jgi:hypothetical protein
MNSLGIELKQIANKILLLSNKISKNLSKTKKKVLGGKNMNERMKLMREMRGKSKTQKMKMMKMMKKMKDESMNGGDGETTPEHDSADLEPGTKPDSETEYDPETEVPAVVPEETVVTAVVPEETVVTAVVPEETESETKIPAQDGGKKKRKSKK